MYSSRIQPRRSRDFGGRGRGPRNNGQPRGPGGAMSPPGRQYSRDMQGRPSSGPPPGPPQPIEHIDREKEGGHHDLDDYATRGKEPQDEVQMYTWTDATLRELTDLVKEVQTAARNPRARLQFALIYPDRQGKNVLRQVGSVHASRHGPDDLKTLKTVGFQTGDFLDVAILT